MRKKLKLPTILGLFFLIAGVVSGVFLINSTQVFKLGAQQDAAPKNIRVTNITNTSITVTWTTDIETKGFVKWGESKTILSKVALEEYSEKNFVHSATLTPISANSEIYFEINSDGTDWDNEGLAWQSKTLSQNAASVRTLSSSGSIVNSVGEPPKGAIVYLNVSGAALSAPTSVNGSWIIPVSNYLDLDLQNTVLEISVQAGTEGSATAMIYPQASKNTPLIVLGKTYDFRTLSVDKSGQIPESELSVPESIEASSRFEVGNTATPKPLDVTLDSVDEGEIITTTDPEFFGKAPKNTAVEITVESELQTATITATSAGSWKWSPPNNLEPGEHTVTIKWKDTSGILRTITKTFVVSAAEGPAFESTPSATPLKTSTPLSSPSSLPTASGVATSSSSPEATVSSSPVSLPDSGSLTPTITLFIMGIGVLTTSIFIWKKAYA